MNSISQTPTRARWHCANCGHRVALIDDQQRRFVWAVPPNLDHLESKGRPFQVDPEDPHSEWVTPDESIPREERASAALDRLPEYITAWCRDCGTLDPVMRAQVLDARRESRTKKVTLTLRKPNTSHSVD